MSARLAPEPGPGAQERGVNLADLVRDAAARAGGRTAVVAGDERRTWSELDREVDGLAAALGGLGLTPGDRVAVCLGAGLDFVRAWFGALRAGLVVVPLNPGYTPRELAEMVADCGARLVLAERAQPGAFDGADRVVLTDGAQWAALLASGSGPVASSTGGEALAALVYTAGTSGRPRGAMLSHRALRANLDQVGALDPPVVGPDDVVFVPLPLFHIYGLNIGLCLPTAQAATVVLARRFDPVAARRLVHDERVTVVIGAPSVYLAWSMLPPVARGFAGVRVATSGAAPLPAGVLARMLAQTGRTVYEGYGLTETAPVLTFASLETGSGRGSAPAPAPRPGSVGRPLPGVELRLLAPDGSAVADGDPGEVVVRGPNLFSGYWPDGAGGPDADGWFATGDVAVTGPDGDLRLVDRLGDVIIVSGFNVYPREVEDVLRGHPGVADVVVVGTPHPYTGETVRALVQPTPGATATPAELQAYAARSLARYKCPTVVELVGTLPRGLAGKPARARLRERP